MSLAIASFDVAQTLYLGRACIQLKRPSLTGVTAATDTITTTAAHGLAVGQQIQYLSGTGFTGLTANSYYFVVAVPSPTTFKISATKGGAPLTPGTSTVGVIKPVLVFAAKNLEDTPTIETKPFEFPDEKGTVRQMRSVLSKAAEVWKFDLFEVRRLLEVFDGAMSGFREDLTCTLVLPDPSDATGTVALLSEADFTCEVMRDGSVSHGNSDYSKATIQINSTKAGPVTWTANAVA